MPHIAQTFLRLSAQGHKGLIPLATAGNPYPEMTVNLIHALVKDGSNVVELDVPFSDLMADGPMIQRASERALAKKVGLHTVLEYVRAFRTTSPTTPVVLMGYTNPIECMGVEAFAKAASEASTDGVLVVDYLPEEREVFTKTMRIIGIGPIFLLASTSTGAHITQITHVTSGYIYYVSFEGMADTATIDLDAVAVRIPQIRQHARLPVNIGFDIHDATTVRTISGVTDAVVIRSRIVQLPGEAPREQAVQYLVDFIAEIRQAFGA